MKVIIHYIKLLRNNKIILIWGPDGSGKTSVTNHIMDKVTSFNCTRIYLVAESLEHLHRPLVSTIFKLKKFNSIHKNNSPVGFVSRILMHFIRYLELVLRLLKLKRSDFTQGYILADRYPYDYFLRNFEGSKLLYRMLFFLYYYLYPKPAFVFLLNGDPEIIHKRDADLSIEQIQASINKYKKFLIKHKIPHIDINVTKYSIQKTGNIIIKRLNFHDF